MSLQELPRTAANGAFKLIRLPVDFATSVRELVAEGLNRADESMAETHTPAPRPKPAPKPPKPAAKAKPKAAGGAKPSAKAKPRRAATTPKAARPTRTPSSKTPAAEEPAVVTEQTDGLEDATDRAITERRGLS